MHTYARSAPLLRGLTGLVVLLAVALLATPTQAATMFFDDFEDDVIGSNPVINTGSGNIGSSWDNEVGFGVDVVTNPNSSVGSGNESAQVLRLLGGPTLPRGASMDGNFESAILFDGTTLSMDFYMENGDPINKVGLKFRSADEALSTNWALNLQQSGDITGNDDVFVDLDHFGPGVWQNATWSFSYTGAGDLWDIDLTFTRLTDNATVSATGQNLLDPAMNTPIFTEISARGQGPDAFGGYVDNIQVATVPEPGSAVLAMIGLIGFGLFGSRRRRTT